MLIYDSDGNCTTLRENDEILTEFNSAGGIMVLRIRRAGVLLSIDGPSNHTMWLPVRLDTISAVMSGVATFCGLCMEQTTSGFIFHKPVFPKAENPI